MSEEKRIVELDKYEHRAVVNIINDNINKQVESFCYQMK